MISLDSKLLEALKASTCFGIAHDETVPECKQCDVKAQCKLKAEGEVVAAPPSRRVSKPAETVSEPRKEAKKPVASSKPSAPAKPVATKPNNSKPAASKPSSNPNMPDFKGMELPALQALAAERNVEWKDYNNDNITRMRLIMALKKSYE